MRAKYYGEQKEKRLEKNMGIVVVATIALVAGVMFALSPQTHNIPAGSPEQTAPASGSVTAEQLMSQMDTNRDGKITIDEAPDELKTGFDYIGVNGDGGIDVQEAQIIADYANRGSNNFDLPLNIIAPELLKILIIWMVMYAGGSLVYYKNVKVNYTRKIGHFTLIFIPAFLASFFPYQVSGAWELLTLRTIFKALNQL